MDMIQILGVKVNKMTLNEVVYKVQEFLNEDKTHVIYTPNTEIVMMADKDYKLKHILNTGDLVIPDGIGLVYASKIKGKSLPERVTGFDLSVKMLKIANDKGSSLFLLGGKEGIAQKAAKNIKNEYPGIRIAGYNNGYFKGSHIGYTGHQEEMEVIEKINNENPDILFVGLGAPKQEKWIDLYKNKLKCKVIIGNGGTMDILAGEVKRAPKIYQKLGLEWFYRLIKQPSRIKRQVVLPKFMLKIIFSKNTVQ